MCNRDRLDNGELRKAGSIGGNRDLVQLETKGLGELSLVEVEGVEEVRAQFNGSRQMQEVRGAGI